MIKRSLVALEYPNSESFSGTDVTHIRKIIAWLEENKIKKYKSENPLKNISSPDWPEHFNKYKKEVSCPELINLNEELEWFLGYALQLEYSNKRDVYNKHAVESVKSNNVPNVVTENPLDKLNFRSKEFGEGINNLAKILKITPHPDPLVTLKAISKVITNRLNTDALNNPQQYIIKGTPFPFQEMNLGFAVDDVTLTQATKIMRMLYIHNLRQLQTNANELIVAVQNVTANPKTDTTLGKVGK